MLKKLIIAVVSSSFVFGISGKATQLTAYSAILQIKSPSVLVETNEPSELMRRMMNVLVNNSTYPENKKFYLFVEPNLKMVVYSRSDYLFVIIGDRNIDARICSRFLLEIGEGFTCKYLEQGKTFYKRKYAPYLREQLKSYLANPHADKLKGAISDVNEVKEIMQINVEKLYQRGAALESLTKTTAVLEANAEDLYEDTEQLRCQKCLNYWFCCFASCCVCCT